MSKGKPSDALCCCEYINQDGERSHILACLCECDAVDQAADRCIRCQPVPADVIDRFCNTVHDRFRFPWLPGRGAMRVRLDVFLPILAVPAFIYAGAQHPVMTVLATLSSPAFLLCVYQCWSRSHTQFRRTNLFYAWALFSVFFCYLSLLTGLITLRKVMLWELMALSTLFLLLMYALVLLKTKKSLVLRGYSRRSNLGEKNAAATGGNVVPPRGPKFHRKSRSLTGLELEELQQDSKAAVRDFAWCKICDLEVPPRSGHCSVCNVCVAGRDHHCVWIDECIGAANHRAFFFGLTLFIVTGSYGVHLTLTSICTPSMYMDWLLLPSDCRFVYEDPLFAWMFSGAAYASCAVLVMCLVWLHQFVLISQNITSLELHRWQTVQKTSLLCCFPNQRSNRGFLRNWADFLLARRAHRDMYEPATCSV